MARKPAAAAAKGRRTPEPPPSKEPGTMAGPLREILAQRRLSGRALSLAAGLTGDTVRNLLSGRARSPRGEVAQALADYLGVSVAVLYGREPIPAWPPTREVGAMVTDIRVPEIEFLPRKSSSPHELADVGREEVAACRCRPRCLWNAVSIRLTLRSYGRPRTARASAAATG